MMMKYQLTPVGVHPDFPSCGNCCRTEDGFLMGDHFGSLLQCQSMLETFHSKPDDIYLISYPKTGSTWLAEVLYLIGSDLDFSGSEEKHLWQRFCFLDLPESLARVEERASPRFFKCHYPYSVLPDSITVNKCKIIYLMRNPKDTLVSYYHFSRGFKPMQFKGDFRRFFQLFVQDNVFFSPYWKHCLQFWERRKTENIFIITYEEMKQDLPGVVMKLATFLDKKLPLHQIESIVKYCSFNALKTRPSSNPDLDSSFSDLLDPSVSPLFRKGQVGDWKNYFTKEMNETMENYIVKYFGSQLDFIYE